jgi:hypothetical protein
MAGSTFIVKCRKTFLPEKWGVIAAATSKSTLSSMDNDDDEPVPVGPFTDFGQFGQGRIDLRVFLQSEYWVDAKGTGHTLTSMDDEYRRNVVRVLLVSAEKLHIKVLSDGENDSRRHDCSRPRILWQSTPDSCSDFASQGSLSIYGKYGLDDATSRADSGCSRTWRPTP